MRSVPHKKVRAHLTPLVVSVAIVMVVLFLLLGRSPRALPLSAIQTDNVVLKIPLVQTTHLPQRVDVHQHEEQYRHTMAPLEVAARGRPSEANTAEDELVKDQLILNHFSPSGKAAWNPFALSALCRSVWDRYQELLQKKANVLTTMELASLRRYRIGGLGILAGTMVSSVRQRDAIERRCRACESISYTDLEVPQSSPDMSFVGYTQRRRKERFHTCFHSQRSMFLLGSLNVQGSVFEQVEQVMGLLFLGALSGRTVVVPRIRGLSGKYMDLSELFDVRHLYSSARTKTGGSGVCILDEDEFVHLEAQRQDLLQQNQPQSATISEISSVTEADRIHLLQRISDVSCLRVSRHENDEVSSVLCEEVNRIVFPWSAGAGSFHSATEGMEQALDEVLAELSTSFHRFVHVGELTLSAVAAASSAIAGRNNTLHLGHCDRNPSSALWWCLWKLLQPHPFTRRAAKLADVVLEEKFPSAAGRARTLATNVDVLDNNENQHAAHTNAVLSSNEPSMTGPAVLSSPKSNLDGPSEVSFVFRLFRSGDVAIHEKSTIGHAIPCLSLSQHPLKDISLFKNVTCSVTPSQIEETMRVVSARRDAAVIIHHAAENDGDAMLLSTLLFQAASRLTPPLHMHVITTGQLFHRNNRVTGFFRIVADRTKLYLGRGNLLLLHGLSLSGDRPFQVRNPFVGEPELLSQLTAFWMMVAVDDVLDASPWSSMSRLVHMRRGANPTKR